MGKLIIPAAKFYAPSLVKTVVKIGVKLSHSKSQNKYIYIHIHIITYKLSCQKLSKRIPTKGTNDFTWSSVISKKTTRHQHQSPLTAPGIAVPGFGSAPASFFFSVPTRQAKKIPPNHHIFIRSYTFQGAGILRGINVEKNSRCTLPTLHIIG